MNIAVWTAICGLAGSKFYTTLDLTSGYYQIPMTEESKAKTAFVTPNGQREFNRTAFNRINKGLGTLRFNTAVAYIDDILVPSLTIDEG